MIPRRAPHIADLALATSLALTACGGSGADAPPPLSEEAVAAVTANAGAPKQALAREIRALVDHAFRVNKGGHVDVNQVLSLRKLEIQDVEWKEAMKAIADAITVVGKAEYIRFYEKTDNGGYKAIVIDWSKL